MINILDVGYGNSASIANTLDSIDYPYELISKPAELHKGVLIIPGVGSISAFNQELSRKNWSKSIKQYAHSGNNVIGICLGFHALTAHSEESNGMKCMGFLGSSVKTIIVDKKNKRSNTGWAPFFISKQFLEQAKWNPYFGRSRKQSLQGRVFYNHRYGVMASENAFIPISGREKYASLMIKGNFMGIQFHPEKSQEFGRSILEFIL